MRLLLDTHALLWFLIDDPKLSSKAKDAIVDPLNDRWLSPISLLEIAVKIRIGRLPMTCRFDEVFPSHLISNDIHLLPIETTHIEPLATMPLHHRDPFDRLLISTAIVESLTLISSDSLFDAYGVSRLW